MNWNVYSRILDEKIGDAKYDFDRAEKKYRETKARLEALNMEKLAFEEHMQIKMDELDPGFAGVSFTYEENAFGLLKLSEVAVTVEPLPQDTKLTAEDHEAVQLNMFFSGNY